MAPSKPSFTRQLTWLAVIWTASVLMLGAVAFVIRTVLL